MAIRILIIEDEPIGEDFKDYLTMSGHHCDLCNNVDDGIDRLIDIARPYHILILDLGLPVRKNGQVISNAGFQVLEHIKSNNLKIGIIIVTNSGATAEERNRARKLNAHEYLRKHVDLTELQLTVENLFRALFGVGDIVKCGDLQFNFLGRECLVGDRKATLSKKDFDLLEYLYHNRQRVITHSAIFAYLWPEREDDGENMPVFQQIRRIRRSIEKEGGREHIQTIQGIGYKFICD